MSPSATTGTATRTTVPTAIRDLPEPGPLYGALHLPDYPVQAFTRQEPELRCKPVAVIEGRFPLLTVLAANRFARRLGVVCGMSKLQLEQFSGLTIRHRSPEQEDSTHRALLDSAYAFTPRIEDTAPDTITLDLHGLAGLWGTPRSTAQRLFRAAAKLGLDAQVAVGPNPEAAIHAVRSEAGITVMTPEDVSQKLAALPLDVLPATPEVRETFRQWGLATFADLTRLPTVDISQRLGQDGIRLQQMAIGKTMRPLRVPDEKPYFKESMELEHSINSLEPLTFILSRLLHQITKRMAARNRTTNALTLTLKLDPAARFPDPDFVRTVHLPLPIRDPEILLKLVRMDLDMHRPPAPIVHVALEAEPVSPRRTQDGLFVPLAPEPEKLELTLARIRGIVGPENVGSPRTLDTHHPDAFRMDALRVERWTPPATSTLPKIPSKTRPSTAGHWTPGLNPWTRGPGGAGQTRPAPPMALRLFRPAQPATVEMHRGQPSRILFAERSGKMPGKISGKIVTARGPWNASGEWWRPEPWNREEWDVEVQSGWRRALYRIYHDPQRDTWFVDGAYD